MKTGLQKFALATSMIMSLLTVNLAKADDVAANSGAIRNVVLVHGAFADGTGWRDVYSDLTARGYNVTIVQNPLTSLEDDVAATKRALDLQDGATVLVGHSWGGTVITEAGVDPKVEALVYVAALAPDAGESTGELYTNYSIPAEFVLDIRADGYGFVAPAKFKEGFAADVSDADAAFMAASQVPINMSAFDTKLQYAAWRTKPSWAIYGTEDKAFEQSMLDWMAERINAKVTKVSASHAIFMSQSAVVAETIHQAAVAAAK